MNKYNPTQYLDTTARNDDVVCHADRIQLDGHYDKWY